MIEIKENQELKFNNLISYRAKIKRTDLEKVGRSIDEYIVRSGAKRVGNPMTATYAVDGDCLDIELLMPIDTVLDSIDNYIFKKQIRIVNAVVAEYKGHPAGLQEACNEMNKYIMEHNLQPITVAYNVTKNIDMLDPNNTEVFVYVGINPNIL